MEDQAYNKGKITNKTRFYQDDLLENYLVSDYSQVEDIAGVDYKKAMILTAVYIFLHLFAKDFFPLFSSVWILTTTALSVTIWVYFKRYFDAMNDKMTANWLKAVIGGLVLYGLINLGASFLFSVENLEDLSKIDSQAIKSIFKGTFQLSLLPILIIFIASIRIINANYKHPFPLKRIAFSSMFFIPIYMLISIVENMPITNQIIDVLNGGLYLFYELMEFLFGLGQDGEYMEHFRIGFLGNLFLMLPYYFLMHHFYRAEVDDATP